MSSKAKPTPLPFEDTLRDLALIRASELDLSSLLPPEPREQAAAHMDIDNSVVRSHEFVREARSAIKLQGRGAVETQGERVENVRRKLEEVVEGVDVNA